MEKLSFIPKEVISEDKERVYGLTENVVRRLLYIINSKKIIDSDTVNLNLLKEARLTLDAAIEKQEEVVKNAI